MNTAQRTSILIAAAITLALIVVVSAGARTSTTNQFDAAASYKQCVACHGAKADKKFDATKPEDELVQIILKGKKMEKPPNMPGYEAKGINEEQAKALVAHMKSLHQ